MVFTDSGQSVNESFDGTEYCMKHRFLAFKYLVHEDASRLRHRKHQSEEDQNLRDPEQCHLVSLVFPLKTLWANQCEKQIACKEDRRYSRNQIFHKFLPKADPMPWQTPTSIERTKHKDRYKTHPA